MKKILIIFSSIIILALIVLFFMSRGGVKGTPVANTSGTEFPSESSPLKFPSQNNSGNNTSDLPSSNSSNTSSDITTTNSSNTSKANIQIDTSRTPKRISHGPIAGAIVTGTLKDLNIFTRYIEKGTGHIYDYRPIGASEKRVSSVTIPRIQEAYFGNKGQSVLMRYEDADTGAIKNYLARLPVGTTTPKLDGVFISDNITDIAVAPVGDEVTQCPVYLSVSIANNLSNKPDDVRKLQTFLRDIENMQTVEATGLLDTQTKDAVKAFQTKYKIEATGNVGPITRAKINSIYCERVGGQVVGSKFAYIASASMNGQSGSELYISDFDNKKITRQFISPLGEWRILWPNKTTFALLSSPSYIANGYAYTLPAISISKPYGLASLNPLVSKVAGLTILPSPKLDKAVYSASTQVGLRTFINTKSSTRTFPVVTLPQEKCVWSNISSNIIYCASPSGKLTGNLPDNWYQGVTSFADSIYKIDTDTDTVTLLYSANNNSEAPDVNKIFVSSDDSYLFYINKKDSYLWLLPLTKDAP